MSGWSMQRRETLGAGILLAAQVKPNIGKRVQANKVGSEKNNVLHLVQSPCAESGYRLAESLSSSLSE